MALFADPPDAAGRRVPGRARQASSETRRPRTRRPAARLEHAQDYPYRVHQADTPSVVQKPELRAAAASEDDVVEPRARPVVDRNLGQLAPIPDPERGVRGIREPERAEPIERNIAGFGRHGNVTCAGAVRAEGTYAPPSRERKIGARAAKALDQVGRLRASQGDGAQDPPMQPRQRCVPPSAKDRPDGAVTRHPHDLWCAPKVAAEALARE